MEYQENDIFYQDDEYSARAEYCNLSGLYHIEEIEADEKGRRFQIVKNPDNSVQNEIYELKDWFNYYYAIHEQKYNRMKRMGDTSEDWDTLMTELDKEAEEKRKKIQELEKILHN